LYLDIWIAIAIAIAIETVQWDLGAKNFRNMKEVRDDD